MNTRKQRRCHCTINNTSTCKNCSQLKMVILLKQGNTELKKRTTNGIYVNPVWYNYLSKNNKPIDALIQSMWERFSKSKYLKVTNRIIFYDNRTKQQIRTIKIN